MKKIFFIFLLWIFFNFLATSAMARDWRSGFFSEIVTEAVFFPKNQQPDLLVAPSLSFISGYQAKDFSINGGFAYYFSNFFGQRDMLAQFGGEYKIRSNITDTSFFAFGIGGHFARNVFTNNIRGDGEVTYFFIPDILFDFYIGNFFISIKGKTYVPIKTSPELGYSIGGGIGAVF
ncbi:MAG: hypothetical protein ACR2NY_00095 [Alphaproteobacteria bacterium]